MAIGERFLSAGTRGIARFLADHQHCEAGFDVRREDEPGSGKLKITCEGCGETVSYRAADAVNLAAGRVGEGIAANGGGGETPLTHESRSDPGIPPRPPKARPSQPAARPAPPKPPARRPRPRLAGWVPAVLIGAVILGGLGMIIAGLTRSDDDADTGPTATSEPAPPTPAAEVEPEPQPQPAPPAATGEPQGAEDSERSTEAADVELDHTRVADTFSIGIPKGWGRGEADGGISIAPDGGTAEIRIFFESGERPNSELARSAADFLADEHKGAQVSAPGTIRVGGERGARIHASYGGGEEDAVVLSDKDFAFLLLSRVDRGASDQLAEEADAILASFKAG